MCIEVTQDSLNPRNSPGGNPYTHTKRASQMEVKQHEIRQDMEKKLRNVQEQAQEKYQKSV